MRKDIIIVGQQKTGTTGVYSLIKAGVAAMAVEYYSLFEPSTSDPIDHIRAAAPNLSVVTKVMYKNASKFCLDSFSRRILTARDPRDAIVSGLLFKPMVKGIADRVLMSEHNRFIEALRDKEADPRSTSVVELQRVANEIGYRRHRPRNFSNELMEIADFSEREEFFVIRYEDFVRGEVSGLANYVELPLNPDAAVTSSWLGHISRSRDTGAWRHWFTKADVDKYRPMLAGYLARMGYPDDWELAPEPFIDAATSSDYVADRLEKRRRELNVPKPGREVEAPDVAALVSMAEDGDVHAAIRLADLLAGGGAFGSAWPVSARYWAYRAEIQGSSEARQLRERLDRQLGTAARVLPVPVVSPPRLTRIVITKRWLWRAGGRVKRLIAERAPRC